MIACENKFKERKKYVKHTKNCVFVEENQLIHIMRNKFHVIVNHTKESKKIIVCAHE
jgi:proteasome assembly chaperone (PAC2) family protein